MDLDPDRIIQDFNAAVAQAANAACCMTPPAAAEARAQARQRLTDVQERIAALAAEIPT